MNPFANIFKHPRTSAAGLLIAVTTVAGVLTQSDIGMGKVGGGTVVSLAGALASALLGLIARDPGQGSGVKDQGSGNTTAKLSVWLLITLLLPLPWLEGCTGASVAQNIVNWTPSLQSAVATVDSTAALLAPTDAPIFTAATTGFDAASNLLITQARAYLANPSASTLAQLQSQVVTLQQQVNGALLSAARIVDANSQKHALTAINAVGTIVTAILALVQSISTKAQVAQMASASTIKLAMVEPYLNRTNATQQVAAHYNEPLTAAQSQVVEVEQSEMQAGF